jgi:hypothetical protein
VGLKDAGNNDTSARLYRVAQLHLGGWDVMRIAREVKCSQSQVWEDIALLRDHWRKAAQATFEDKQNEELAKLAAVESVGWQKGDMRTVLKVIETRLRMWKMIGPRVVVQQNTQINVECWDQIQGAASAGEPPDTIEERLARERVGCPAALSKGPAAEGGEAGAAASGSG